MAEQLAFNQLTLVRFQVEAHFGNLGCRVPSAERFPRVNAEFLIAQREVRTDDPHDQPFPMSVSLPKPGNRSLIECNERPRRFEPLHGGSELRRALIEPEPLPLEILSLSKELLVSDQVADPQLREVPQLTVYRRACFFD